MRVFSIVKNAHKALLAVVVTGGLIVCGGGTAEAVGSNLQATICGADAKAQLTITEPTGDSVVPAPSVELRGTVAHATAIEVKIDDAYDSTLPLESTSTQYATRIMLQPGTHTISLQANDVCLVHNAITAVVVTYQPAAQPSAGATAGTTAGGVAIGIGSAVPADGAGTSPTNPLGSAARALDLDTIAQDGTTKTVARVGLMVSGLATITIGAQIIGQISPQVGQGRFYHNVRIVRMCGLVPLVLALMV